MKSTSSSAKVAAKAKGAKGQAPAPGFASPRRTRISTARVPRTRLSSAKPPGFLVTPLAARRVRKSGLSNRMLGPIVPVESRSQSVMRPVVPRSTRSVPQRVPSPLECTSPPSPPLGFASGLGHEPSPPSPPCDSISSAQPCEKSTAFDAQSPIKAPVSAPRVSPSFAVVESSSVEEIKKLFDVMKVDPDQMDADGQSLLHVAASRNSGALEVCQYLVETLGVYPNFCDNKRSWTPVFHAAANGNHECIEYLVASKCGLNHLDLMGSTAMYQAVKSGSVHACQALHSLGCQADQDLFQVAVETGQAATLDFLLSNGLSAAGDVDGLPPLHAAKNRASVEVLMKHHVVPEDCGDAIFSHIKSRQTDIVRFLLEQKCSPDAKNKEGKTCIQIAIEESHGASCTVNAKTHEERTAAIYDMLDEENKRRKTVEEMDLHLFTLVSGTTPLCKVQEWIETQHANTKVLQRGETILFAASARTTTDVLKVVEYFVESVDPAHVNLDGETAIFRAVRIDTEQHFAVVKFLIERKCDPNQASACGATALSEAVEANNVRCVKLLLEHSVDVNSCKETGENVLFAAKTAYMVDLLLAAGADAIMVNAKGRNCLFDVPNADMVSPLIAARCTVHCTDVDKESCLFSAVTSESIMHELLNQGADVRILNSAGQTCLHRAVELRSEAVAQMLVESYMLDPFKVDNSNCSPIMIAQRGQLDKFVQFVELREESIKLEQRRRTMAPEELKGLLWGNATLDDVKTFVNGRMPFTFDWRTPELGQTLLFFAVYSFESRRSDSAAATMVEYFVNKKVDPTVRDKNEQTALFYAARYSGTITCRLLMEKNCAVNARDTFGETPLTYARRSLKPEKIDVVNALLDQNADPSVGELFKAIEANDTAVVQAIVSRGCPMEPSKAGKTLLFAATVLKNTDITSILLAAGANVHALDDNQQTVLFDCSVASVPILTTAGIHPNHATAKGHTALFSVLTAAKLDALVAAKCDVRHVDVCGRTCLFAALASKRMDVCERLIRHYFVDPAQVDTEGKSCISIARESGCQEFPRMAEVVQRARDQIEKVLALGTAFHGSALDTANESALDFVGVKESDLTRQDPKTGRHYGFMVASRKPDADTVTLLKELQKAKVDLLQRDISGQTCLFAASKAGNVQAMQFLLTVQCSVEDVDIQERTPLFDAALGGNTSSLRFLLSREANAQARSEILGETILFDAIRGGSTEMVLTVVGLSKYDLNAANRDHRTPIMEALRLQNLEILKMIVQRDATVTTQSDQSPLFFCESAAACLMLIEFGGDVNAVDANGRTPLFAAIRRRNRGIVDVLCSAKSDVNHQDINGRTPIFQCVEMDTEIDDILNFLIDVGADLTVADKEGNTPSLLAANEGKSAFVASLKKRIERKEQGGISPEVRLVTIDGRCLITFYNPEHPEEIIPYGSDEYKRHWNRLRDVAPDTFGAITSPWSCGI